ncbi:MAG: hydrolase [Ruminococcaceae bacterium]|jgi:predicted hydrolase (HD superfamily)|nr:hydrolase [Oscillospiraceae bacterium]
MLTYDEAYSLLKEYNEGEFHLKHGRIVGDVMRWFAESLGYGDEADFWQLVGLLHDLDFEKYPDEHCVKSQEIMRSRGIDERLVRATASHGWEEDASRHGELPKPEHEMEKVLYATDELTGLIGAVALMRPSKSCDDLEVKSVKKKYKDKRFAAGCDRAVIERGAEMLGWDLDRLIEQTILAMRASENVD